jgi:hypothetical protein
MAQVDSKITTAMPTPEVVLPSDRHNIQAIGRLRKVARDEIDRPIRFLGKTDT